MKKYISMALCAVLATGMLSGCGEKADEVAINIEDKAYYEQFKNQDISINVYNWGEYISDGSESGMIDVNKEFEALTGIKVNYTTYATNEEMYAKMKGGGADYDIIIPSDYMISRMIKEDMLAKIDYSQMPNTKHIMDNFRGLEYDVNDEYSVPYTWGTVGIIYDNTAVDVPDGGLDWDILWDERYKDSILMFDNPRDSFGIACTLLGYSMNTESPSCRLSAEDFAAPEAEEAEPAPERFRIIP